MKKRTITIFVLLALSIGYFVTRMFLTNRANEAADAFFTEFSVDESAAVQRHLHHIDQTEGDHLQIIERHRSALRNFTYQESKPDLNFMLNKATVPVSWHLTIVMQRSASGWHIVFLDE